MRSVHAGCGVMFGVVILACTPRAVHRTAVADLDGGVDVAPGPGGAGGTGDVGGGGGGTGGGGVDANAPDLGLLDGSAPPDGAIADGAPVTMDAPLPADAAPVDVAPPVDVAAPVDVAPPVDIAPPVDAPPPVDAVVGACAPGACKRVFLSSTVMPNGAIGSLATNDTRCQALASARNLGGTWRAWLADVNGSPSTRFAKATVPYRLLDGTLVAASFTALTSGTLMHAIDMDETGASVTAGSSVEVWTGATVGGGSAPSNCGNWTNNSAGLPNGSVGVSDRTNAGWTQAYTQFCDRTDNHLYCFEQ